MSSWLDLLIRAEPGEHVVQLYGDDDQLLARNVSRYLAEGLRRGDGLVVIATPEHTSAIARHLVAEDAPSAREAAATGRLVYLDAGATLAQILGSGGISEPRFRRAVCEILGDVRSRSATGAVRAFGEMVSLLWDQGRTRDAERLEALWNTVLGEHECSLFCAYHLDLFDLPGRTADLHPIVRAHDHLLAGSGTLLSSGRSRN
jgi:hypothetical protein